MIVDVSKLDYADPNFDKLYGDVLTRINGIDPVELKQELEKAAVQFGLETVAASIPFNKIGIEGKIAYCFNRGARLPAASLDKIKQLLEKQAAEMPQVEVDIDDEISNKMRNALKFMNAQSLLDTKMLECSRTDYDADDLASYVKKIIRDHLDNKPRAIKKLSDHFKETFDAATREELIDWLDPLEDINDTLDVLLGNRASVRRSLRKAKLRKQSNNFDPVARRGEKDAVKMTYKTEDIELGIKSIKPTTVIGAELVLVFNTKNRHCEIYKAGPDAKLGIKGARIINFDPTASGAKTIRKPNQELAALIKTNSIKKIDAQLSEVNGKNWSVTGKINKHCLIIKVI